QYARRHVKLMCWKGINRKHSAVQCEVAQYGRILPRNCKCISACTEIYVSEPSQRFFGYGSNSARRQLYNISLFPAVNNQKVLGFIVQLDRGDVITSRLDTRNNL